VSLYNFSAQIGAAEAPAKRDALCRELVVPAPSQATSGTPQLILPPRAYLLFSQRKPTRGPESSLSRPSHSERPLKWQLPPDSVRSISSPLSPFLPYPRRPLQSSLRFREVSYSPNPLHSPQGLLSCVDGHPSSPLVPLLPHCCTPNPTRTASSTGPTLLTTT
jgi:hypothetical protein